MPKRGDHPGRINEPVFAAEVRERSGAQWDVLRLDADEVHRQCLTVVVSKHELLLRGKTGRLLLGHWPKRRGTGTGGAREPCEVDRASEKDGECRLHHSPDVRKGSGRTQQAMHAERRLIGEPHHYLAESLVSAPEGIHTAKRKDVRVFRERRRDR
jgi:hypothetical protein